MRSKAQRHVRLCDLRSSLRPAGVVFGARSFWSETLLLRPQRKNAGIRFRSESPASRAADYSRPRSRIVASVSDFPLGSRSEDHVSRNSQASGGTLRDVSRRRIEDPAILGSEFPARRCSIPAIRSRSCRRTSRALSAIGGSANGERRSNRRISQRGFGFFQYRGHDVQGNPAAGSNLHHHVSAQISCGRNHAR